jgi:hypothetical protein
MDCMAAPAAASPAPASMAARAWGRRMLRTMIENRASSPSPKSGQDHLPGRDAHRPQGDGPDQQNGSQQGQPAQDEQLAAL